MFDALQPFFDEGTITEYICPLKSGKEADVLLCRASPHLTGGEELVVAKVHRDRSHRGFANDARYLEGRYRGFESVEMRAMRTKTRFGREVSHAAWIGHEWETLRTLSEAGARVPRPIQVAETGILMTYVGDEDGAAPRLREVRVDSAEAGLMWDEILRQVRLMLSLNLVHADLSAFNILVWEGAPVIIDLPQAVDPRFNPNAHGFLRRDLRNVADHLSRGGLDVDAEATADDIWTAWEFADLWLDP